MRISRVSTLAALAASLVSFTGTLARADFTYSSLVGKATADGFTPLPGTIAPTFTMGDASLTLTAPPPSVPMDASGAGTDIVFGLVSATKATSGDQPLTVNYDFRLYLTDNPNGSRMTDFVDIMGGLKGDIRRNDAGQMAYNTTNFTDPSTYTLTFAGRGTYTISDFNYTPVGATSGRLGAVVRFSAVPEPTSVALVAIGGLGALLSLRGRRAASA